MPKQVAYFISWSAMWSVRCCRLLTKKWAAHVHRYVMGMSHYNNVYTYETKNSFICIKRKVKVCSKTNICYYKILSLRFSFKAWYPVAYNSIMLCVRPVLVAYITQHLTWRPNLTWRPDLRTDLHSNYFATPFSLWMIRNNRLPLITGAPTENASHVMMATGLEKFGTLCRYLLHKLIHIMR